MDRRRSGRQSPHRVGARHPRSAAPAVPPTTTTAGAGRPSHPPTAVGGTRTWDVHLDAQARMTEVTTRTEVPALRVRRPWAAGSPSNRCVTEPWAEETVFVWDGMVMTEEQTRALPSLGIRAGPTVPWHRARVRTGPAPHRTSPRSMRRFYTIVTDLVGARRNSSLRTARWRGRPPARDGALRSPGRTEPRTAAVGCPASTPTRRTGPPLQPPAVTTTRTPPATRARPARSATRSHHHTYLWTTPYERSTRSA